MSTKIYTNARTTVPTKQNYAKVVNSSSSATDGDLWRDNATNDMIYRKGTTDINLTRTPPIIKMVRSGNYTVSTGWQKIQLNSTAINTSISTSVDASNYRIVIPETGIYEVKASFGCSAISNNTYFRSLMICNADASGTCIAVTSIGTSSSDSYIMGTSTVAYLSQGSYLTMWLYSSGVSSNIIDSYNGTLNTTWLSAHRIG